CHLHCQDQLHTSKAAIEIYKNHFQFAYGTASIMKTENVFFVVVCYCCATEKADLKFLEVNNQKVTMLEMLQLLGVNRVVVYKTNCSADAQRVLNYYSGLVEVIPWSLSEYLKVSRRANPYQDPGDIHYYGQVPALNDCLYRYMYRSKYIALHDLDELILPQSLLFLRVVHPLKKVFTFENNWIPSEFELPPPKPNTLPPQVQWQNISGVNILTHLYREPFNPILRQRNFKVIINPRVVFVTSVHRVIKSKKSCAVTAFSALCVCRPRGPTSLKPKQLVYEGRLLSYSAHLTSAVNTVLKETGLLPGDSIN
uniref:Glycosyltransferase family 92 protein n=1 Tax=Fundulus heteroclitus TaxID=8078 RepID=A0A3Q2P6L3_FUNHE